MKLKPLMDRAKLDLKKFCFGIDSGTAFSHDFEIRAEDFITFAKADFFKADTRGLVNALSNAKRAIDCQADNFILAIGLDPQELKNQLGSHGIASVNFGCLPSDTPLKFRLLRALGVAAPEIVARSRRVRNMLEHDYRKPKRSEVSNAIDIAELFVQACRGKMQSAFDTIWFGSGILSSRGNVDFNSHLQAFFHKTPKPHFEVTHLPDERNLPTKRLETVKVEMSEEGFIPLLKLLCRTDWNNDMTEPSKTFLTEMGFHVPSRFRVHRDL